jgi:glycosyltransferase involved in cell wall biosynthesis
MRILIAHEAAAGAGGVESYLAALFPVLAARGHQLAFLHHNPRGEQGPTRLAHAGMPAASVSDDGLEGAVSRMRTWRPDVCFSHNMRQLEVEERLASEWPVVKMMHGYFGTCISGQKAHAFPGVVPCRREFGPPCLALYLPRRCGHRNPLRMVEQYGWASRQRALFDRYTQVVVASGHMAAEYARHGIGPDRLTAAPLFSTDGIADSARPLPAHPTVLFAGRMTRIKGGAVLVRAAAMANRRMPVPVRLVFAGEGPERDRWRDLAVRLGVSATFTGWVSGPDRIAVLRGASLVAVPSLWPEPFGLVGLEAAAHGVPAIAFDVGGIRDWLQDDVGGRIVGEIGSARALGRMIAAVCTTPVDLTRLGDGARRAARALTIDVHLEILERVFSRAIAQRPALSCTS